MCFLKFLFFLIIYFFHLLKIHYYEYVKLWLNGFNYIVNKKMQWK